ncbi:MAG: ribonuclease P protein component [Polyangiaceae bacterium]
MKSPRVFPAGSPIAPRGAFPKSERVRKRREYLEIQAHGRRVMLSHFVLVVCAREPSSASAPRIGITASRKVGVAAVRSRVRRLVREAYRATRDVFPNDADVVVIVKRAPKELALRHVVEEFRSARAILAKRIDEARRELNTRASRHE